MGKELISVIIPIYNVAPYLDRCIESVCNQTYRNLQIILVDDGSTDDSVTICDRCALKDGRIVVIHKENGGLVSARKAGLKVASGEYVAYVDGDDWIEPDMYEQLINRMQDVGADLVESDAFIDMGQETIPMRSKVPYGVYDANELLPIMLCDDNFNECQLKASLCLKLFRRGLLEEVQFQVNDAVRFGEDAAVVYPYVLQCNRVAIMDYAGYHYVQRPGSMAHNTTEMDWESSIALIKGLDNCFRESGKADRLLVQLNQYAKVLCVMRHISYLDAGAGRRCLLPFGGIEVGTSVIIYGAGLCGQSIYRYLNGNKLANVVCWVDREYEKFRQIHLDVQSPETVLDVKYRDVPVIIAVNSRKTAMSIRGWLLEHGVEECSIMWLTEEFIESDLLSRLLSDAE